MIVGTSPFCGTRSNQLVRWTDCFVVTVAAGSGFKSQWVTICGICCARLQFGGLRNAKYTAVVRSVCYAMFRIKYVLRVWDNKALAKFWTWELSYGGHQVCIMRFIIYTLSTGISHWELVWQKLRTFGRTSGTETVSNANRFLPERAQNGWCVEQDSNLWLHCSVGPLVTAIGVICILHLMLV
jgi:hypothetical protein